MRLTTHRPPPARTALATLILLLAGCGSSGGSDSAGSGTVSPSPSPTTSPRGCGSAPAELGAADTGRTYCLATGGTLRLSLDGTASRPWTPVKADGSGLEATNGGIVLRPGDASAAFRAVAAGTVRLTSSRPLCATGPDQMSCKGIQEWTVTVRVTQP